MSTQPSIIITRLDLQRLERLLDELEDFGPGAQALESELARAQVVGHDEVPPGVVTMNTRVHCREEASGKDYHLTLVYPKDAGGEGTVSILAPIGSALLGLSDDWAKDAILSVGNYGQIFDRNLGSQSPLDLARGLNAQWNARPAGLIYGLPIR